MENLITFGNIAFALLAIVTIWLIKTVLKNNSEKTQLENRITAILNSKKEVFDNLSICAVEKNKERDAKIKALEQLDIVSEELKEVKRVYESLENLFIKKNKEIEEINKSLEEKDAENLKQKERLIDFQFEMEKIKKDPLDYLEILTNSGEKESFKVIYHKEEDKFRVSLYSNKSILLGVKLNVKSI